MFRSFNFIRIDLVGIIKREIIFDGGFRNEFFNIIANYIKKNFALLEITTSTHNSHVRKNNPKRIYKNKLKCYVYGEPNHFSTNCPKNFHNILE